MSVQKVSLCPFHWKPRQSGVSLESPGLENIPQVPGKRAEVAQNHDARNAVSATVSVLKWSEALFLPRSLKVSVQKVYLCLFHCKPKPSGATLESPGLENIPQLPGNRHEVGQNHDLRKTVLATLSVLSKVVLYFGTESRKCAFKKLCCVHFNANQSHQELV